MAMLQTRLFETELLDILPPDDAAARGSRRDLRTLNRIMAHPRAILRMLRIAGLEDRGQCLIDLGAGDGWFALNVIRKLRMRASSPRLVLVDRQLSIDPQTKAAIENTGWSLNEVKADVFDFVRSDAFAGAFVMANLFLHHFTSAQLRDLFRSCTRAVSMVACEPRRSWPTLASTRLLPLLGCNAVTRHDADLSVRSGFRNRELSKLWPETSSWHVEEGSSGMFSHRFMAARS